MENEPGASPGTGRRFRVILWHAAGASAPPRLTEALGGRGIAMESVTSAFDAMADICLASRAARSVGEQVAGSVALVIVHPERLPDAAAVVDAAGRYAPGVRCWMYGPASGPQLRAVTDADLAAWRGEAPLPMAAAPRVQTVERPLTAPSPTTVGGFAVRPSPVDYRTRVPSKPALRLSGEPSAAVVAGEKNGPAIVGSEPAPPNRAQLLTPEELRMLLGEDEPEAEAKR